MGCAPYVILQKALVPLPQAKSLSFGDASRSISNEVDVFPTERAASAALVLYAKSSMVGCLENLFKKQTRQEPELQAFMVSGQLLPRFGEPSEMAAMVAFLLSEGGSFCTGITYPVDGGWLAKGLQNA